MSPKDCNNLMGGTLLVSEVPGQTSGVIAKKCFREPLSDVEPTITCVVACMQVTSPATYMCIPHHLTVHVLVTWEAIR